MGAEQSAPAPVAPPSPPLPPPPLPPSAAVLAARALINGDDPSSKARARLRHLSKSTPQSSQRGGNVDPWSGAPRSPPTIRKKPSPPPSSPTGATAKGPPAQAIFYDDSMYNFDGNLLGNLVERAGKVPAIRNVHCEEPLTLTQLEEALRAATSLIEAKEKEQAARAAEQHVDSDHAAADAAAAGSAGRTPTVFEFYDFDGTLSLEKGLDIPKGMTFGEVLTKLFGDEQRQKLLRDLLSRLLAADQVYILTANQGYELIARLLNQLLLRGEPSPRDTASEQSDVEDSTGEGDLPEEAPPPPPVVVPQFIANVTVLYTPAGSKVRTIRRIVRQRGYTLAPRASS